MNARIAFAGAAAVALGACAYAQPIPAHGGVAGYVCHAEGLDRYVGQQATADLGAEMLRGSGARVLRWLKPGQIITMEFSAERLSVHLDDHGKVERASCG